MRAWDEDTGVFSFFFLLHWAKVCYVSHYIVHTYVYISYSTYYLEFDLEEALADIKDDLRSISVCTVYSYKCTYINILCYILNLSSLSN